MLCPPFSFLCFCVLLFDSLGSGEKSVSGADGMGGLGLKVREKMYRVVQYQNELIAVVGEGHVKNELGAMFHGVG